MVIPDDVMITGSGLILREWAAADTDAMVELFDEASIDAWTPLESPFGTEAALRYLERARRRHAEGAGVQLAITADGAAPLGEVLLSEGDQPGTAELAYAVGLAYRGQGLACRAVTLVMDYAARSCGISSYTLRISPANLASQRVAREAGFRLTDAPLEPWQCKGRRLDLAVWRGNELPRGREAANPAGDGGHGERTT